MRQTRARGALLVGAIVAWAAPAAGQGAAVDAVDAAPPAGQGAAVNAVDAAPPAGQGAAVDAAPPAGQGTAGPASAAGLEAQSRELVIMAGGDVMFGRYIKGAHRPHGGDDPFAHIAAQLREADLSFVNLETPLMEGVPDRFARGSVSPHTLTFRGDTRHAEMLESAGIRAVSLANNHAEDCRDRGIRETEQALDAAGIHHAGTAVDGDAYAPAVFEIQGAQVVLLAVTLLRNLGEVPSGPTPRVAYFHWRKARTGLPALTRDVRARHPDALLLVSIHWGMEYSPEPYHGQRVIARATLDAGADIILGHHPHVLQPVEAYGGRLIIYSMGNLVFDMTRDDARRSALFEIRFRRGEDSRYWARRLVMHPLLVTSTRGPRRAPPPVIEAMARALVRSSRTHYGTTLRRDGATLVWEPPGP